MADPLDALRERLERLRDSGVLRMSNLDAVAEALALLSGERVTLWRWVDPEQPYDDHRGEWQTGSHPEPLDTDVELRTALLLPQENPR